MNNYYQPYGNFNSCRPPCPTPYPPTPPTFCATGATGPTGPQGVMGLQGVPGPIGPTERLFKSSNKTIIDSS